MSGSRETNAVDDLQDSQLCMMYSLASPTGSGIEATLAISKKDCHHCGRRHLLQHRRSGSHGDLEHLDYFPTAEDFSLPEQVDRQLVHDTPPNPEPQPTKPAK